MRKDIHPKYYPDAKFICTCGTGHEWTGGSTQPEIRLVICSKCHPFYTGEQRIVDTAGQVERFRRRFQQFEDHKKEQIDRKEMAAEKAETRFLNQQLLALSLPDRLFQILTEAGYVTVGDIIGVLYDEEEKLMDLEGFGPKSLEQLMEKVENLRQGSGVKV
ncbi:MAG: 50S ribosomal protein L31 [Anaerolineaceae bacterium 4572_78]|nr:MAG: 50S ribosomal protein L31 [Anaerolineaceae bacterium 4572_78]